jgi:hypothetical protein
MAHPFKDKAKNGEQVAKSRGYSAGYKNVDTSTTSMQHKKESAASGYKRGGAVASTAAPAPSPVSSGKRAGAGPSTAPATQKKVLKKGGADSGVGRLEKARAYK